MFGTRLKRTRAARETKERGPTFIGLHRFGSMAEMEQAKKSVEEGLQSGFRRETPAAAP